MLAALIFNAESGEQARELLGLALRLRCVLEDSSQFPGELLCLPPAECRDGMSSRFVDNPDGAEVVARDAELPIG
jgi:hypothetical protein